MPPTHPDVEHPSLERKDLDPSAREPHTDASGEGWGSYYEGPVETDEDQSLLDRLDATGVRDQTNADPRQDALPQPPDHWGNETTRDFRREPRGYPETTLRPPDEDPDADR